MKNRLNILLIEPRNEMTLTGGGATPPLWPCVLSSLTPKEHHVDFIHCSYEDVTEEKLSKYDLIGISSRTDTACHAYQIGDICKKLKIPCVIGGIHAFFLQDEAKEHCDSVVLGEAECLWQNVLEDARKDKLKEFYKCEHEKHHDIPASDLSITRKYKYNIKNIIETVRGCPYNCSFCSATIYNGKTYRYKPIENIINEIDSWTRKSSLAHFADLNIASNFDKAKEVFSAIAPYNLTWWGSASVNVADDDELLRLMAKSGCSYLGIGMESISKDTLTEINKGHNINTDFKEMVRRLHDYNIDVYGFFIFGMDTDTIDDFKETAEFVIEAGIDFPIFQILTPYPGTRIYNTFKEQGRLLTQDWSKYTRSNVVYKPKNMTPRELVEAVFWIYEEVYSKRNIIKRFFSRWRGVKRNIYNTIMISHFAKQVKIIKRNNTII